MNTGIDLSTEHYPHKHDGEWYHDDGTAITDELDSLRRLYIYIYTAGYQQTSDISSCILKQKQFSVNSFLELVFVVKVDK